MALKITKTSPVTGKQNTLTLDVTAKQIVRWQNGELIQDVMPNLNATEREFLITGMTPEEQDEMYKALEKDE